MLLDIHYHYALIWFEEVPIDCMQHVGVDIFILPFTHITVNFHANS